MGISKIWQWPFRTQATPMPPSGARPMTAQPVLTAECARERLHPTPQQLGAYFVRRYHTRVRPGPADSGTDRQLHLHPQNKR